MLRPARATRPVPPRRAATVLVAALLAGLLGGCTGDAGEPGDDAPTVALLLADDARPHWQARTVPAFESQLTRTCPACRLVTHVADGDADRQAEQLAEAVEEGADAVVLAPVSPATGAALVADAADVPVVALDGALPGAAHVVTTDGAAVGRQQAAAVVAALGGPRAARGARVLLLDGAASGAEQARRTALRSALRAGRLRPVPAAAGEDLDAEAATRAVRAARRAGAVDAVVAASDVQAGGARQALGARPVPVVGADADLDAVRRLVTGAQAATVWGDERSLGARAAAVAGALATGLEPRPQESTTVVAGVPTDVVAPQPVTLDEVARLLVRRGVVSVEEVCDAATRGACERAGLV